MRVDVDLENNQKGRIPITFIGFANENKSEYGVPRLCEYKANTGEFTVSVLWEPRPVECKKV
jgi:hypothetical protein